MAENKAVSSSQESKIEGGKMLFGFRIAFTITWLMFAIKYCFFICGAPAFTGEEVAVCFFLVVVTGVIGMQHFYWQKLCWSPGVGVILICVNIFLAFYLCSVCLKSQAWIVNGEVVTDWSWPLPGIDEVVVVRTEYVVTQGSGLSGLPESVLLTARVTYLPPVDKTLLLLGTPLEVKNRIGQHVAQEIGFFRHYQLVDILELQRKLRGLLLTEFDNRGVFDVELSLVARDS